MNAEVNLQMFVNNKVLVLPLETPVRVAARAMAERQFGSAVICDPSGHPVGILTDRDVACQVVAYGVDPASPVSEVMTDEVYTIDAHATIEKAITAMVENGIRRIPLVERIHSSRERCVGIVTLDDLAAAQAISAADIAKVVREQVVFRPRRREPGSSTRSDDKLEQTLARFVAIVAAHTGLNRVRAEMLVVHALSEIIKRLPSSEAGHFVSQLPKLLHEDLLSLRAGPDSAITDQTLLTATQEKLDMDETEARRSLAGLWSAVTEYLKGSAEPGHVLESLPGGIAALLRGIGEQRTSLSYIQ